MGSAEAGSPGVSGPGASGVGAGAPSANADAAPARPLPERAIGSADAPVTIIEYASMTCPHCRTFHVEVLPQLRADYIDAGKVRLVFRDFPLDRLALAASMVARCAPPEKSLDVTARLFETQPKWAAAEDPIAVMSETVAPFGLDAARVDGCIQDETVAQPIIEEAMHGQQTYEITSTPTFIVNGEVLTGLQSMRAFEEKIAAALQWQGE